MTDLNAIKERQQQTWAAGDFSVVAWTSMIVSELRLLAPHRWYFPAGLLSTHPYRRRSCAGLSITEAIRLFTNRA
jgi:hypothetical protein